jgi:phage tail sheath protein FI
MAETLISPGVFLQENDLSQITQGPVAAGAAIVGPTVTGPVNIPTLVTSYSEYKALFGASFVSGGASYEYLTGIAALNYFEQGGESLLVTRVASGSYTPATADVTTPGGTFAKLSAGSINVSGIYSGSGILTLNGIQFKATASAALTGPNPPVNTATIIYTATGSNDQASNTVFAATASLYSSRTGVVINTVIGAGPFFSITASVPGTISNGIQITSGSNLYTLIGGTDVTSFTLETLTAGTVMNNSSASFAASASNGALVSGSTANVRFEITSTDTGSGLFNMIIRRGDDFENSKTILETWNGLSLDPNQGNYVAYVIGDQAYTVATDDLGNNYLQLTGSYANKSKYVRVKSVDLATPSYFNSYGQPLSQYTASLPNSGSGSFNGSFGTATGAIWGSFGVEKVNFFENIPNIASSNIIANSNIQGVHPEDYTVALNLLGNRDAYDFNVLYTPGLTSTNAPSAVNSVVNVAQTRGDNIAVIDMVGYGQQINAVVGAAQAYDNSYAATYWPWLQIRSRETGKLNFVPASTIVPAAYEYNDKVAAEWWAPAGLNRGALPTVLQPERKLTSNDRDRLYQGSVNPIATFPGVGTVIYGQKTLQQKASALDRVNVRRLLISLKSYIGQIGETLVFEPNTQVTRNKFINQVNPYLESVQQRQGLYAFQVVMDETNNTPSVIDRNQLVGTIYLQPTRTAEFIQLDFNILPTGTTFGQ